MRLKRDIKSVFKDRIYGYAGDEVKLISVSGNVLIVEGPGNERFSVLESDVGEEVIQLKPSPPPISEAKPRREIKQKKKVNNINSKSLFE